MTKPKIYFKRYPSGLGFWCVSDAPPFRNRSGEQIWKWKEAYRLVSNLNNPVLTNKD